MNTNLRYLFYCIFIFFIFLTSNSFSSNKLSESFTSTSFPPGGWRSQHNSGITSSGVWFRSTSGYLTAPSCAQSNGGLLEDNFLITGKFSPQSGDSLVFWVSSNYVLTALGRLDVKVSTTDSAVGSFIDFLIPVQINLGLLTPNVFVRKAISLDDYAGQDIYIAFRHIEVGGLFGAVRLDGIVAGGVDLELTSLIEAHSGIGWFIVPRRDRDTVNVSVRSSVSPFQIIDTRKVFLDTLGNKIINFTMPIEEVPYYIYVTHRNSLRTWSRSGGDAFTPGSMTYDFTTGLDKAFGNNMTLVEGKSFFYSGDVTFDGVIDLSDVLIIYNDGLVFTAGPYVLSDLNWDQYTDLTDQLIAHNHSVYFVSEIAP